MLYQDEEATPYTVGQPDPKTKPTFNLDEVKDTNDLLLEQASKVTPTFDSLHELAAEPTTLQEYYGGFLKGLPKVDINLNDIASNTPRGETDSELRKRKNQLRSAFDAADAHGIMLKKGEDGSLERVKFDPEKDFITAEHLNPSPLLGYKGIEYYWPVDENGERKPEELWDYLKNPGQIYKGYSVAIDPETGKLLPIEVSGTKKELAEQGHGLLPRYGFSSDEDGFFKSSSKSLINMLSGIDESYVALMRLVDPINPALDVLHYEMADHEKMESLLPSQESHDLFSGDWLGSVTGSTVGSLAVFGGTGRGIRLAGSAANMIGKAAGKEVLSKTAINQLSTWGASSIVGFGFAHNDALNAGLSKQEAWAYGMGVGFLTTWIEKMGPTLGIGGKVYGSSFDDWLTGGGIQDISKTLLRDFSKDATEEGMAKLVSKFTRDKFNLGSRIVKQGLPEAGEEVLQSIVEQGAQLTYNAFKDPETEENKGKFSINEFSFNELISGAVGGFMGGSVFSMSSALDHNIPKLVMTGHKEKVLTSLDQLYMDGKVDLDYVQNVRTQVEKLDQLYIKNQDVFKKFSGKNAEPLKRAAMSLLIRKSELSGHQDRILKELGLSNLSEIPEDSQKAKEQIEAIREEHKQIDEAIQEYQKPEIIEAVKKQTEEARAAAKEYQGDEFAFLSSMASGKIKSSDQLGREFDSFNWDSPVSMFNTFREVWAGLNVKPENLEPEQVEKLKSRLSEELQSSNLHLLLSSVNPKLRGKVVKKLVELGISEDQLPLSLEQVESLAGAKDERYLPKEELSQLLEGFHADLIQNSPNYASKSEVGQIHDQWKSLLESDGISESAVHSMSQHFQLKELLSEDQFNAFDNLLFDSYTPASIILENASGNEIKGLFDNKTGALVIVADFQKLKDLKKRANSSSLTTKEKKELKKLESELFHVLAHEAGHGNFDKAIDKYFQSYKHYLKSGQQTQQSALFERMFNLVALSDKVLSKDKDYDSFYFSKVYSAFAKEQDPETKLDMMPMVMKEFYAEALSNESFQKRLDAFDLGSPKNIPFAKSIYDYKPVPGVKKSLLSEVVKAVKSVFASIGKMMDSKQRSLLSEAFILGSGLRYNRHIGSEPAKASEQIEYQSISSFNIINLYPEVSNMKPEELGANVIVGLKTNGVIFSQNENENAKIESDAEERFNDIAKSILEIGQNGQRFLKGTLRLIYFNSTDSVLIAYDVVDNSGETRSRRVFTNKYGNRINVNTNPRNSSSPVTLSKPSVFRAFDKNATGDESRELDRELINNLYRAQSEGFIGETTLEFDPLHEWSLNGRQMFGQINTVYQFEDGTKGVIGYTHDLTKIRLGSMLQKGMSVKMEVKIADEDGFGAGSFAYVRKESNEQGINTITDVVNYANLSKEEHARLRSEGYEVEKIMPRMNMFYKEVSGLTDQIIDEANEADSLTPDDESLEARLQNKYLLTGVERFLSEDYPDIDINESSVSFYDNSPNELTAGDIQEKIDFFSKATKKKITRELYWRQGANLESIIDVAKVILSVAEDRINESTNGQGNLLGFEDEVARAEHFVQYAKDEFDRVIGKSWRKSGQDWDGHGVNPHHTISEAIKADLESITYEWDGKRSTVSFSEASSIMFPASEATHNFDEMLGQLKGQLSELKYFGRSRVIAQAIVRHLESNKSEKNPNLAEYFKKIENSYWSQFASYERSDGHSFGWDKSGNPRMYVNGSSTEVKRTADQMRGKMVAKLNELKTMMTKEGITDPKVMMDFIEFEFDKTFTSPTSTGVTHMARMKSDYSYIKSGKKNLGHKSLLADVIAKKVLSNAEYSEIAERVQKYFQFFDIDLPDSFFARTEPYSDELRSRLDELVKGGMSKAEATEFLSNEYRFDFYKFKTVEVESKDKKTEEVPVMNLLFELADWMNSSIYKDLNKSAKQVNFEIKQIMSLAKEIEKFKDNYNSPEFYFDVNFNKRWAYKIKSYTDHLFQELSLPKSKLLKKYLKSDLYKNNLVLQKVRDSGGKKLTGFLAGLISYEDSSRNSDYNKAGDLDYIMMSIMGFVSIGNQNSLSSEYLHIGDVPSDKPNNKTFRLDRVNSRHYNEHVSSIIKTEEVRERQAEARFQMAFKKSGKEFVISDLKYFNELIPDVHYNETSPGVFTKGWIFDKSNGFYGGKDSQGTMAEIETEIIDSYKDFKKNGLAVPLPASILSEVDDSLTEAQKNAELESKRKKIYRDWYFNNVINRYWLSQLMMGDYAYYKPDKFGDLSKRMAGTFAPFNRMNLDRDKVKLVALKDIGASFDQTGDTKLSTPKIDKVNGKLDVTSDRTEFSSIRTDAQGYVTEQFAETIEKGYGALAEYKEIFKPVMFGVNEDNIEYGQPLYLKMALATLPDPSKEENISYYDKYPNQLPIAQKIYNSGADIAVFESGIKVGLTNINKASDEEYLVSEFDANLFGMQNNPQHDPFNDDNVLNGLVQQTKQLGDNSIENTDRMAEYHGIEGSLLSMKGSELFEQLITDPEFVKGIVVESFEKNDFSMALAELAKEGINLVDNPNTSTATEQLVNSRIKNALALYKKPGEKFVNVSDIGFGRPQLTDEDAEMRDMLLSRFGSYNSTYSTSLKWVGPRKIEELTLFQLRQFTDDYAEDRVATNDQGYIIDTQTDDVVIYPAEVLVPPTKNHQLGDKIIATRIPTSKKSSSIPSVVVGWTHKKQGNIIVTSQEGPGMLGFDFDVDGLFAWRRRYSSDDHSSNKQVQQMFDIAYGILTDPANYNEITSPTITDTLADLAEKVDLEPKVSVTKFSPIHQVNLKKLNSVGKMMIGVSAKASGIHSVLSQVDMIFSEDFILIDSKKYSGYPQVTVDQEGNEVRVTDIFSELINASTDNAKLQLLGRLNINLVTAPVFMEMITHGVPLHYAVYFINQPIIKEYVRRSDLQDSASFENEKDQIHIQLLKDTERYIQTKFDSVYQYDPKNDAGESIRTDISSMTTTGDFGLSIITKDTRGIPFSRLEKSIDPNAPFDDEITPGDFVSENESVNKMDEQLRILDKFKYYKSLSSKTGNIGALVSLTSSYPKSFVEAMSVLNKIEKSEKSFSNGYEQLTEQHGVYSVHYRNLKRLVDYYKDIKLYGNMWTMNNHTKYYSSLPTKVQEDIVKDFYTFQVIQSNSSYEFGTTSFNGQEINPYFFVHYSAQAIEAMKNELQDNEFLKVLDIKKSTGTIDQLRNQSVEPSMIQANLLYDLSPEMLARVHQGFNELTEPFTYQYEQNGQTIAHTIQSPQSLILGHLVYTKGFAMGGFSYSKILPIEVIKEVDQIVQDAKDFWSENDTVEGNTQGFDLIEKTAQLSAFNYQTRLNHPSIIRSLKPRDIELMENPTVTGKKVWHPDYWGGSIDQGAVYRGAVKYKTENGRDTMYVYAYNKNAELVQLLKSISNEGIVKLKGSDGIEKMFAFDGVIKGEFGPNNLPAKQVVLKSIDFINTPKVKQYSPIASKLYEGIDEVVFDELAADNEIDVDPMSIENMLPEPMIISEGMSMDLISGKRTAITFDQVILSENIAAGQMLGVPSDGKYFLVKAKKAPYSISQMVSQYGEDKVQQAWAEYEGVPAETFTAQKEFLMNGAQLQVEFLGILDEEFKPINLNKPGQVSSYDNDQLKPSPDSLFVRLLDRLMVKLLRNEKKSDIDLATIRLIKKSKGIKKVSNRELAKIISEDLDKGSVSSYDGTLFVDEPDLNLPKHRSIVEKLFPRERSLFNRWKQFENEPIPSGEINLHTGEAFTYQEWYDYNANAYQRDIDVLKGIQEDFSATQFSNRSFGQVRAVWEKMDRKISAVNGLAREEFEELYELVQLKLADMVMADQARYLKAKTGKDFDPSDQKDVPGTSHIFKSIADFSSNQLGLQYLNRELDRVDLEAKAEREQLQNQLNLQVQKVMEAHFNYAPKSIIRSLSFWKDAANQKEAMSWLFEMDADGAFTGDIIKRYESEEQWKDRAWMPELDEEGNRVGFKFSNRNLLDEMWIHRKHLSSSELVELRDLMETYAGFFQIGSQMDFWTAAQKSQYSKDTGRLRRLYIKAMTRSVQTEYFNDLERVSDKHSESPEGKLAKAKLDFYDFIYKKGNLLMEQAGFSHYTVDRAFMPHVKASWMETISEQDLMSTLSEFTKTGDDKLDDIQVEGRAMSAKKGGSNFGNSASLPFRTIARKKSDEISFDVSKIFSAHLNTLIFKKHYDGVLPLMQAIKTYYDLHEGSDGKGFETLTSYINLYANEKLFHAPNKEDKLEGTVVAKTADFLSTMAVTAFLGLAPATSAVNAVVGLTEDVKFLIGEYGYVDGTKRFWKGMYRLIGVSNAKDIKNLTTHIKDGNITFSKKATEIMNHYGVQIYASSEVQAMKGVLKDAQDIMLFLQKSSEIMNKGVAFFGMMSDEQWNAFEINDEGLLVINDESHKPTSDQVSEWKIKIGNILGKYDASTKRLHTAFTGWRTAALFKGWMVDYFLNRFGGYMVDSHGNEREGYYRTSGKMILDGIRQKRNLLSLLSGKEKPSKLEQRNMRMVSFDLMLFSVLTALSAGLDDDDKEYTATVHYLNKINSQLFSQFHPVETVNIFKSPFPQTFFFERAASAAEAVVQMNGDKFFKNITAVVPGKRQIIDPALEGLSEN